MDKKQRLKLKTLDNSILSKKSEYSMDSFTRDSSIMIPPKITVDNNEENTFRSSNKNIDSYNKNTVDDFKCDHNNINNVDSFKDDHNNAIDNENSVDFDVSMDGLSSSKNQKITEKIYTFTVKYGLLLKNHWINFLLISIIFYLIFKPSEYKFLLDEIENLKKENTTLQTITKIENIADITSGTSVVDHSDLYNFGFFKLESTDPNSIFEPGNSYLSLKGNNGFFEIKLKGNYQIRKIAVYHPEKANPRSAIKDFIVHCGKAKYNFEYCGKGYEEFSMDGSETDLIRIEFENNHGEVSYTSIYRIFIFS